MASPLPPSGLLDRIGLWIIGAIAVFAMVLLFLPSLVVLIISFDTRRYVSFPPEGFTFDWYRQVFQHEAVVEGMLNSLQVGVTVTLLCILLGVPTALVCARGAFRGVGALSVFVMIPHMVPGIVLGIAVLFAGAYVKVGPSITLQSVSITVYVLAVMVRTVTSRLQRLDPQLDEAAANLGATPFQTLRSVTLPLLMPAILAGAVFTFVEGFDNISVAIFTHGFHQRPLPVELITLVTQTNTPLVAAVSGVQIVLAVGALWVISRTIGLDKVSQ
ncbi:ABC transporter permease [Maricaulis maris]|uniref:ABC transporter permease n=1 Tax=Maricaulis maris TaxID=74318 RepID=UPI003A8DB0E3